MNDIVVRDPKAFSEGFLREYCAAGLGRMSKRDVDVLVFYRLLEDGRFRLPEDIYKACRELRLTEAKVRNLYQEVQLKYMLYGLTEAKSKFIQLVEEGAFEVNGKKITFIVRDPLLRQYFEEWVASQNGFADSSFNKNLVVIHQDVFAAVLGFLAGDKAKFRSGKFSGELKVLNGAPDRPALFRLFAEEFMKSAGNEAGSMSVRGIVLGLKTLILGQVG